MLNVENRSTRANAQGHVITSSELYTMSDAELWTILPKLLPREQDNESIIACAAYAAAKDGKITLNHLDMMSIAVGNAPTNIHTYNEWKARGYIVKSGEHAAFSANIWKHVEKRGELTAEEAEAINAVIVNADAQEGDEVRSGKFIKKVAHFFTLEQVEALEELDELPSDCTKRIEGNKEIVTGNTKPIKERLKASGYKWHRKNHYWYKFTA